jgi:hypothetical protein
MSRLRRGFAWLMVTLFVVALVLPMVLGDVS